MNRLTNCLWPGLFYCSNGSYSHWTQWHKNTVWKRFIARDDQAVTGWAEQAQRKLDVQWALHYWVWVMRQSEAQQSSTATWRKCTEEGTLEKMAPISLMQHKDNHGTTSEIKWVILSLPPFLSMTLKGKMGAAMCTWTIMGQLQRSQMSHSRSPPLLGDSEDYDWADNRCTLDIAWIHSWLSTS